MTFQFIPPSFITVYEDQSFVYNLTFYNGVSSILGITAIDVKYAYATTSTGIANWLSLPSTISSTLQTFSLFQDIRLSGSWPKVTFDSDWTYQSNKGSSSTQTSASYETVVRPYNNAIQYRADSKANTSVIIRVIATYGTPGVPVYGTFYAVQTLKNSYNKKRNQVIPFVQGGSSDVATFRFPGGSLGGYVGEDLPEPQAESGLTKFYSRPFFTIDSGVNGRGTFTVPVQVSSIIVTIQGGGASGGSGYITGDYSASGAGGGSGGYQKKTLLVSTGQQLQWEVGRGGIAIDPTQGDGTSTIFGTLTAGGGKRGQDGILSASISRPAGGAGGLPAGNSGGSGSVGRADSLGVIADQSGGKGADAVSPNIGQGGVGGNKLLPTGVQGQTGTGYGAGGGGGGTQRGTRSPWVGGDGLPGSISLEYFGVRYVFNDVIVSNTISYNLLTAAAAAGWDGFVPLDATVTINAGVYVYSDDTSLPAFIYENLPAGSEVKIINNGFILGKGGGGGGGRDRLQENPVLQHVGLNGGPAIILNSTELLITNSGYIAGGGGGGATFIGGGGGGAGGGDGAGYFFGGAPGIGGLGGGPGASGAAGTAAVGGGGGGAGNLEWNGAGGGGGRVLPGTGGAAGTRDLATVGGRGGGAGGGGGGADYEVGRAGGSANNPGDGSTAAGAISGGGGGWGASGGAAFFAGGVGGKAIETNGYTLVLSSVGTIYGAISGSSSFLGFSAAVTSNQVNMNVRNFLVNNGWDQLVTSTVIVPGGIWIWSDSIATAGMIIDGSWSKVPTIYNNGNIIGRGGNGGVGNVNGATTPGQPGGPAISTTTNIKIHNNSYIAGGGGGGSVTTFILCAGGGGAGGGNGSSISYSGPGGAPASAAGGAGGAVGQAGANGSQATWNSANDYVVFGGGGGGGRILPGVGGYGNVFSIPTTNDGTVEGGGGGAGGGGSGYIFANIGGTGGQAFGVEGGSGNAAGRSETNSYVLGSSQEFIPGGGGGGGWGAAGSTMGWTGRLGGGGAPNYTPVAGGLGGKAISTNGNSITFLKLSTIWGAVS